MTITYRELLVLYKQDILSLSAAIISEPISNETINYFKGIYKTEEIIDTMHKRWAYGRMQYDTLQFYHESHGRYLYPVCKNAVKRHHYTFNAAQLLEDNYRPMHQIINIAELVHKYTVSHKMSLQEVQEIIKFTQIALRDSDNQILLLEELIERIDNDEVLAKTTPLNEVIDLTIRPETTSSPTITPLPHHIKTKYAPETIVKATPSSKHPVVTKVDDNNSSGGALVQTIRRPTTSTPSITPMPHHIEKKTDDETIDVSIIIDHASPSYMPDANKPLVPVIDNKYTDTALMPLDRYDDKDIVLYNDTKSLAILSSDSKSLTYISGFAILPGMAGGAAWFISSIIGLSSPITVAAIFGAITLVLSICMSIASEFEVRSQYKSLKRITDNPDYKNESLLTIKEKREAHLNNSADSERINRRLALKINRLKRLYIIDDTPYFGYMFLSSNGARDKTLPLNIPNNAIDVNLDKTISHADITAYSQYANENAPSDQTVIDAVFDVYYTKEKTKQTYIDKRIEVLNTNKPKIETTPYYQTMLDSKK